MNFTLMTKLMAYLRYPLKIPIFVHKIDYQCQKRGKIHRDGIKLAYIIIFMNEKTIIQSSVQLVCESH